MRLSAAVFFSASLLLPACTYAKRPFDGRWDFATTGSGGVGANWLGVTEKNGRLDVWFQPTGGHVHPVTDFKTEGAHMTLTVSPASGNHPAEVWELDAQGDKLTGTQK